MLNFKRIIIYVVLATITGVALMFGGMPLYLAGLASLGFFSLYYMLGEYLTVKNRYRKADQVAFNKAQGVPAIIGAVLVTLVNIMSTITFFVLPEINFNMVLNLILIIMVAFLSAYSFRSAYIYITDNILYCGKEIPLENIVRYTAAKNRKGKYIQIAITYNVNNGTNDVYMSYSKELEELLDSNLSKKKRGY